MPCHPRGAAARPRRGQVPSGAAAPRLCRRRLARTQERARRVRVRRRGPRVTEVESRVAFDLSLTEEQQLVQRTAREFATNELLPNAGAIDREARFPAEAVRKLGELGFMGMMVPTEF